MSLDDIEKELYGQKTRKAAEKKLNRSGTNDTVQTSARRPQNPWRSKEEDEFSSEPIRRIEKVGPKIFGVLAVVLVILVGFAGYYLYQYFTTRDAQFTLSVPSDIQVGKPFVMTALFENVSKKSLFEPQVTIRLPEGALFADDPDKRVLTDSLQNSMPGDTAKMEYTLVLVGEPYKTYTIDGIVSYRYEASSLSSRFEKDATVSAIAKGPIISLDITSPQSVVQGQDFELHMRYKNETDVLLRDVELAVQLPESFSLNNSDPKLEEGIITLAQLEPFEEGLAIVSGFLAGGTSERAEVGVTASVAIAGKSFPIASKKNTISIQVSPLRVAITSDQKDGITAPGNNIQFTMQITNTANIPMMEVVASAQFIGDLFNIASVSGEGTLTDANRTYTWTAARVSGLRQIDPGQSVSIPFSVRTRTSGFATNESLEVLGTAVSNSVPAGMTAQRTIGMDRYTLRVGGSLSLDQFVYYLEPNQDIQNSGPIPPRVGQATTFTIHWKLRPQGSDAQQVRVRAALGGGMEWTGKVTVRNAQNAPQFNPQTEELIWSVDAVPASGSGNEPEAIFQVSFTPPSNRVGGQYVFLNGIAFSGKDVFTGRTLSGSYEVLDSRDIADANALPLGYDRIRP